MTYVLADETLSTKLDAANEPVSIYSRDGRVIGFFSPAKAMRINLESPLGEEELARRMKVTEGRSLDAIFRELEKGKHV